jgi:hypothetical protein
LHPNNINDLSLELVDIPVLELDISYYNLTKIAKRLNILYEIVKESVTSIQLRPRNVENKVNSLDCLFDQFPNLDEIKIEFFKLFK